MQNKDANKELSFQPALWCFWLFWSLFDFSWLQASLLPFIDVNPTKIRGSNGFIILVQSDKCTR